MKDLEEIMNYELALKLKDAGFPQEYHDCVGDINGNCVCVGTRWEKDTMKPTLSELIEVCGDKFHCLVHTTNGGMDSDKEFWSAGTDDKVINWCNGSTPVEAVAYLWLELQKPIN